GYEYELVQGQTLAEHLPGIGTHVPGATYCPHDGHVNPLRLLRALHEGFNRNGGSYLPLSSIDRIQPLQPGGFELFSNGRRVAGCEKLVIAAGHGSVGLGAEVSIDVPIHPEQGQIVVTERSAVSLAYPTNMVRQTDEGGFLLGPSARDVGFDADTNTGTLQEIVRRCATAFPYLRKLRIQRSWAALRIMTPDGFPVYSQSEEFPGAFAFSCHSGVTLAAVHAQEVCQWVLDGAIPPAYQCFAPDRFNVSTPN
ncbi:MAG: FAD-binding oxidoreductase, partial [Arenicellales bacterium]|nr:FAD-binding oxidoreductase [Arenicellales bacterium]